MGFAEKNFWRSDQTYPAAHVIDEGAAEDDDPLRSARGIIHGLFLGALIWVGFGAALAMLL